jgi:surface carbohydrate biosynthesis protein
MLSQKYNSQSNYSSSKKLPMPTVYICIEQKNREYDEKILLAASLALHGFRCYVGTHAAIWALLRTKKERSGIYFDKGTQLPEVMHWIKTKCEYIVVMDVELGPVVRNVDLMFSDFESYPEISRLYPGSNLTVDRYLCIGPRIFEGARKVFNQEDERAVMTGWPRVDIWADLGLDLYSKEISKIRMKYGSFLLFASDFNWISDPGLEKNLTLGLSDYGWDRETNFNFFLRTVEILKKWDQDLNVPQIIVRPHISEDPRIWKKALGPMFKTHVIHSGDITPWILASKGLVHRGSTTSVQAAVANRCTYFLEEATKYDKNEISHQISDYQVGMNEPPLIHSEASRGTVAQYRIKRILDEVIFRSNQSASDEVIGVLMGLKTSPMYSQRRRLLLLSQINFKSIKRCLGLIRHEVSWKLNLTQLASQLHYTPSGLGVYEIKRLMKLRKEFNQLKTRRMSINLWEISI